MLFRLKDLSAILTTKYPISTALIMEKPVRQGVRVANPVRELNIGIETVCDRRKPKYAMNRTILDKNFHKQLILRIYWQRKAMKHP